jgi:predicted nucleic acid-binding protein
MSSRILIDTSAWIDFLRARGGALGDAVERALSDDTALMCGVVVAELLQGAKGPKERQQLEFLFANVECLPVLPDDWHGAGRALQTLRLRGMTLPLSDALIAAVAQRHGVSILTADAHFKHLSVRLVEAPLSPDPLSPETPA